MRRYALSLALFAVIFPLLILLAVTVTPKPASAVGVQPTGISLPLRQALRFPPTYVNVRVLAANVAETATMPTWAAHRGGLIVVFRSNAACPDWYVNFTETATVPAADVTNGSGSENAPAALRVDQGLSFSVIAPTACILTLSVYPNSGGN